MIKKYIAIFLSLIIVQIYFELRSSESKRAIVIGASSGMGRAVAKLLAKDDYALGLASRRMGHLRSLQEEINAESYIRQIDVSDCEGAALKLKELIEEIGGLDLIVISISSFVDTRFENTWDANKQIIDVDIKGFWAIAQIAMEYFEDQGHGHLVGISSIDGLRGSSICPIYSGAKAFVSRYLEGLRNMMYKKKLPIHVTDIVPGWVDVEHTIFSELPGTYWVSTKEEAARQKIGRASCRERV